MIRRMIIMLMSAVVFFGTGMAIVQAGGESGAPALEEEYPLLGIFKGVKFGGYVDVGANYNFNNPGTQSNALRVFDTKADSATIHMVELWLEKPVEETGYAGFRVDLDFGKDANVTGPADTDRSDEFDIEQAYISFRAPAGNGIDFKVGKFVTLLGAEVIEAPDNYNYSRSFLFGYAIPFTHTGILGSYAFNDMFSASVGIVNGCDVLVDNNDGKTIIGSVTISPVDYFSFVANAHHGAEQNDENSSKRTVIDLVTTFEPPIEQLDKFTFVANFDYGREEDAVTRGQTATWIGLAGYVNYDLSDWIDIRLRSEFFNDDDGARTGTAQDLWEITLTGEFEVYKNTLLRLEYRHDDSSATPFVDSDGNAEDSQDTVSCELAYIF